MALLTFALFAVELTFLGLITVVISGAINAH